jgi:hypothetical protein
MRRHPKVLTVKQILCVFAIFFLGGCAQFQLFDPYRVDTQPGAGAVNISVTMVAPWEEYIATLQPEFKLTAEEALSKVIPKTTLLEEKLLRALSLKTRIGLSQSGELPGGTTGPSAAEEKDVATLPGLQEKDKSIAGEPTQEYQVAAALYQEIQLLNRYVEDAALKYDYRPYVVRIQVAVLPYTRYQPYDVYTTFSFFPFNETKGKLKEIRFKGNIEEVKEGEIIKGNLKEIKVDGKIKDIKKIKNNGEIKEIRFKGDIEEIKQGKIIKDKTKENEIKEIRFKGDLQEIKVDGEIKDIKDINIKTWPAIVLPLFATDSLEGTLHSRSLDAIRQLAFALSFQTKGVGGEVQAQKLREELLSVMGMDINSLMTVSRVTDSSIQVRLGAARHPTAGHAMIPRTHYITCLLMVPKELAEEKKYIPQVKVLAKSIFRDIKNGKPLPTRNLGDEKREMRRILRRKYGWKLLDGETSDLFRYLFLNDYAGFFETLKKIDEVKGSHVRSFAREIWLHFIENCGRSEIAASTFDLPRPIKPELPPEICQTVLLLDDGKTTTTGYLLGGRGMIPSRMSAQLKLRLESGDQLPFMATDVKVGPGGKDPVLLFPSLKAWNISDMKCKGSRLEGSEIIISHTRGRWNTIDKDVEERTYKTVLYRGKEPPKPVPLNFTLRAPVDSVVAKGGAGQLKLFLTVKKKNNTLLVDVVEITSDAQVDAVQAEQPATAKLVQEKIMVQGGDTTLTLTLSNLVTNKKITIKAAGKKVDGEPQGGPHPDIVLLVTGGSK